MTRPGANFWLVIVLGGLWLAVLGSSGYLTCRADGRAENSP